MIKGGKPGKVIGLLGGTHGTEFASIEAVTRVINKLKPDEMKGTVIAIPVLNVAQFEERTQFINPVDNLNLNSVFPGKEDGSFSERLAFTLFSEIVSKCDVLIDCHGGDINEDLRGFVVASDSGNPELNQKSLDLASCYDTKLVHVFPSAVPGMTNSAQVIYDIPCIMPEAGTPYPILHRDVMFHVDGFFNVLIYLDVLEGEFIPYNQVVSSQRLKLHSNLDGVWDCYVELEDEVEAGVVLGVVRNVFGDVLENVVAPFDGIVSMKRCYYSVKVDELLIVLSSVS